MDTYAENLRILGATYLGNVAHSAKMSASFRNGTMTYCIYMAPWNTSGYQVCAFGEHCHKSCLNYSGREKIKEFTHGRDNEVFNARKRKTRLFYENRNVFMELMIHEIKKYQKRAQRLNMEFSVRINGTSDLSPLAFKYEGKNILEIFPNIQFYDYTKNPNRIKLMERFSNYDVTLSFDGHNWEECEKFLAKNGKVAVVFYGGLPSTYKGYEVGDANGYDMRYMDKGGTICGLHYHKTANDYYINENGQREFKEPNTPFVIMTSKL